MDNVLGIRIRDMRKLRGLTQEQLAEVLNITRTTVTRYETGVFLPDAKNLMELADTLNCSTDYLLGRVNNPSDALWDKNLPKEFLDNDIDAMIIDKDLKKQIDKSGLSKDEIRAVIKLAIELRGRAPG